MLELLDQQRAVLRFALRCGRSRLGRTQRLALRDDERVGAREVGRKRVTVAHRQQWNHNMRLVSEPAIVRRFKMLRSARSLRSPRRLRHAPIDTFEQIAKLRR